MARMNDLPPTHMFSEAACAAKVVCDQHRQNRAVIESVAQRLREDRPEIVLTCARGSSDHAATFARYLIETRVGVLTSSQSLSIASVYARPQRIGRSLCIGISQSGQSPDVLAAVKAARAAQAYCLALVNSEDSPLARTADVVLPLCAGEELSVAATKSYIAALAATIHLVSAWIRDAELTAALEAAPELLARAWDEDWSQLTESLRHTRGLYVVGRGLGLGIAQEAALKFKETCGIHAEAFSAAEIKHGPMALAGPDFPILMFRQFDETAGSIDELVTEVVNRGSKVFIVGAKVPGAIDLPSLPAHPAIAPMLQIQSFYRAANALSLARGFDPDRPPHLRKVTKTV
jgi:glucosamine--fructose-6-phosphate aminotransferase (isomerizing)